MSSILSPFKPGPDFQPYLRPPEILQTHYKLSGSLTDYTWYVCPILIWLVSLFKALPDFEVQLSVQTIGLGLYKPLQAATYLEDNFYSKFIKRYMNRYMVKYM